MEKLIFFRHRHDKENNYLINAFSNGTEVNKHILSKLRESVPFDFTEKNINKARTKYNTNLLGADGKMFVNFLEAYMLDGNKVVARQLYQYDEKGICGIMQMDTLPEYRRQGIAESLLSDCEEILFERLGVKNILSTATIYSEPLFKKRGYDINPLSKYKYIDNPLNPSVVEVKLTQEKYNTIKSSKMATK